MRGVVVVLGVLVSLGSSRSEPSFSWMYRCSSDTLPYAHNVVLELSALHNSTVYGAFQAGATEGGSMHLRFSTSRDNGATWSESTMLVPSEAGRSAWGPVLKAELEDGVETLHLFFALSRSVTANFSNPGGDLFHKFSQDQGSSWSEAEVILEEDAYPLYFVNQLVALPNGEWLLPFGSTAKGYPRTAGAAGLLSGIRSKGTRVWSLRATNFSLPTKPNISAILEPAIALVDRDGSQRCFMVFRSADGVLFSTTSTDTAEQGCNHWTPPTPSMVKNPNSRPSLAWIPTSAARKADVAPLVLACNPDDVGISQWPAWGNRSLLAVMSSRDGGQSWSTTCTLAKADQIAHCYPSVVVSADASIAIVACVIVVPGFTGCNRYSVYVTNVPRIGIQVAVVRLHE